MKLRVGFLVGLLWVGSWSHGKTENDLTITEVGAWTTGNSILYVRFDRAVGPDECKDTFAKVYMGADDDNQKTLDAKSTTKAIALTALTAKLKVKINTLDICLHGSPTFDTIYLKSN